MAEEKVEDLSETLQKILVGLQRGASGNATFEDWSNWTLDKLPKDTLKYFNTETTTKLGLISEDNAEVSAFKLDTRDVDLPEGTFDSGPRKVVVDVKECWTPETSNISRGNSTSDPSSSKAYSSVSIPSNKSSAIARTLAAKAPQSTLSMFTWPQKRLATPEIPDSVGSETVPKNHADILRQIASKAPHATLSMFNWPQKQLVPTDNTGTKIDGSCQSAVSQKCRQFDSESMISSGSDMNSLIPRSKSFLKPSLTCQKACCIFLAGVITGILIMIFSSMIAAELEYDEFTRMGDRRIVPTPAGLIDRKNISGYDLHNDSTTSRTETLTTGSLYVQAQTRPAPSADDNSNSHPNIKDLKDLTKTDKPIVTTKSPNTINSLTPTKPNIPEGSENFHIPADAEVHPSNNPKESYVTTEGSIFVPSVSVVTISSEQPHTVFPKSQLSTLTPTSVGTQSQIVNGETVNASPSAPATSGGLSELENRDTQPMGSLSTFNPLTATAGTENDLGKVEQGITASTSDSITSGMQPHIGGAAADNETKMTTTTNPNSSGEESQSFDKDAQANEPSTSGGGVGPFETEPHLGKVETETTSEQNPNLVTITMVSPHYGGQGENVHVSTVEVDTGESETVKTSIQASSLGESDNMVPPVQFSTPDPRSSVTQRQLLESTTEGEALTLSPGSVDNQSQGKQTEATEPTKNVESFYYPVSPGTLETQPKPETTQPTTASDPTRFPPQHEAIDTINNHFSSSPATLAAESTANDKQANEMSTETPAGSLLIGNQLPHEKSDDDQAVNFSTPPGAVKAESQLNDHNMQSDSASTVSSEPGSNDLIRSSTSTAPKSGKESEVGLGKTNKTMDISPVVSPINSGGDLTEKQVDDIWSSAIPALASVQPEEEMTTVSTLHTTTTTFNQQDGSKTKTTNAMGASTVDPEITEGQQRDKSPQNSWETTPKPLYNDDGHTGGKKSARNIPFLPAEDNRSDSSAKEGVTSSATQTQKVSPSTNPETVVKRRKKKGWFQKLIEVVKEYVEKINPFKPNYVA